MNPGGLPATSVSAVARQVVDIARRLGERVPSVTACGGPRERIRRAAANQERWLRRTRLERELLTVSTSSLATQSFKKVNVAPQTRPRVCRFRLRASNSRSIQPLLMPTSRRLPLMQKTFLSGQATLAPSALGDPLWRLAERARHHLKLGVLIEDFQTSFRGFMRSDHTNHILIENLFARPVATPVNRTFSSASTNSRWSWGIDLSTASMIIPSYSSNALEAIIMSTLQLLFSICASS